MALTRTHRKSQNTKYTKTQQTLKSNNFCVSFGFFWVGGNFNFQLLKGLLQRKCWVTALVRSMKNIGGLNQFSAAANITLSQHVLEKKKNEVQFLFFNKATKLLNKTTWKWNNIKPKIKMGCKRENR